MNTIQTSRKSQRCTCTQTPREHYLAGYWQRGKEYVCREMRDDIMGPCYEVREVDGTEPRVISTFMFSRHFKTL